MTIQVIHEIKLPTIREAIEEEFSVNPAMPVMSEENSAHWFNAMFGVFWLMVALWIGHLGNFSGVIFFGFIAWCYFRDVWPDAVTFFDSHMERNRFVFASCFFLQKIAKGYSFRRISTFTSRLSKTREVMHDGSPLVSRHQVLLSEAEQIASRLEYLVLVGFYGDVKCEDLTETEQRLERLDAEICKLESILAGSPEEALVN